MNWRSNAIFPFSSKRRNPWGLCFVLPLLIPLKRGLLSSDVNHEKEYTIFWHWNSSGMRPCVTWAVMTPAGFLSSCGMGRAKGCHLNHLSTLTSINGITYITPGGFAVPFCLMLATMHLNAVQYEKPKSTLCLPRYFSLQRFYESFAWFKLESLILVGYL